MEAKTLPDAPSRNVLLSACVRVLVVVLPRSARTVVQVMAEVVGSTLPHEIVVIGGHIDSWDVVGPV